MQNLFVSILSTLKEQPPHAGGNKWKALGTCARGSSGRSLWEMWSEEGKEAEMWASMRTCFQLSSALPVLLIFKIQKWLFADYVSVSRNTFHYLLSMAGSGRSPRSALILCFAILGTLTRFEKLFFAPESRKAWYSPESVSGD